jgi:hypothetical protein
MKSHMKIIKCKTSSFKFIHGTKIKEITKNAFQLRWKLMY